MSEAPTVPYRTVLPLDRGGRFEVWRIEPITGERAVESDDVVAVPAEIAGPPLAMKCLPRDATDAGDRGAVLRREARLQGSVSHPAIVPATLVALGDHPALVTPLAWGTLDALPTGGPPMCPLQTWSPRDAAKALRRLAEALAALHEAGIVHGDVAPTNVLVLPGDHAALPRLALTDFGCASVRDGPVGRAAGTPGAAAPEVVAGEGPSAASDVYGLGRVGLALLAATRTEDDPETTAALEGWCAALGDPDPRTRPSAASAAATAPARPRVRTVEFGPRPQPTEAVEPPRRRTGRLVGTGAAALVLTTLVLTAATVVVANGGHLRHHLTCLHSERPGWLRPGVPRAVDVLDTGCAQQVTWSGTVLTVRSRAESDVLRYRFGLPGDVVALARWGCTGPPRLALYRPALGEVLAYPALSRHAEPGATTAPRRHLGQVANGQAHLVRDARGCAHLVVTARVRRPQPDR
jgi:hypothetical protein